jgi:hypothetical protein
VPTSERQPTEIRINERAVSFLDYKFDKPLTTDRLKKVIQWTDDEEISESCRYLLLAENRDMRGLDQLKRPAAVEIETGSEEDMDVVYSLNDCSETEFELEVEFDNSAFRVPSVDLAATDGNRCVIFIGDEYGL